MGIYIILMIITFALMLYDNKIKQKKGFFWGLCIVYTLISALRYDVGTDYTHTYVNAFEWLKAGLHYSYEPIFLWMNKFVSRCGGNAVVLISLCAVLTIPLFFRFIQNNVEQKHWFLAVYLYLTSTIYFASMNVLRQYLALAVLLIGFDYLKKNQYFRYGMYVIIATMVHTSAVLGFLFMLVYYIYSNRIWKKAYNSIFIIIYSISVLCLFVDVRNIVSAFRFMIPARYIGYLTSRLMSSRNFSAVLKQIVPNLIMLWMIKDAKGMKEKCPNFELCYVGWILYVIITNLFYGINLFIRLGYYFDYLVIIIAPMMLTYYKNNIHHFSFGNIKMRHFYKIANVIIVGYYTALTIYGIFVNGGHGVVPYKTIFSIK